MIFELDTTIGYFGLQDVEKLKKYGFKFEKRGSQDEVYINIENILDLSNLEKYIGDELIISFKNKTIEIYNDYRE